MYGAYVFARSLSLPSGSNTRPPSCTTSWSGCTRARSTSTPRRTKRTSSPPPRWPPRSRTPAGEEDHRRSRREDRWARTTDKRSGLALRAAPLLWLRASLLSVGGRLVMTITTFSSWCCFAMSYIRYVASSLFVPWGRGARSRFGVSLEHGMR